MGRSSERYLIQKGLTLEKAGDYEGAVEALLQAAPLVDRQGDERQSAILNFNLAVTYTHLRRYSDGADHEEKARGFFLDAGDELMVIRCLWLRGRLAAGLGRVGEARAQLTQARKEFDRLGMSYDVALALLEEAALLLAEGGSSEVKGLTVELLRVFDSKGVHREALAALRLFYEAAEREAATAQLARSLLAFLFRARDDQSLHFSES